jgi:hypothetical protein
MKLRPVCTVLAVMALALIGVAPLATAAQEGSRTSLRLLSFVEGEAADLVPEDAEFDVTASWEGGSQTLTIRNDGEPVDAFDFPFDTEITVTRTRARTSVACSWMLSA